MIKESKIIIQIKKGFTFEQIKADKPEYIKTEEINAFFGKLLMITDKIVQLSLQGYSNEEIGNKLNMSKIDVAKYLGCITKPNSSLYNEETAKRILGLQRNIAIQRRIELYKKLELLEEKNVDLSGFAPSQDITNYKRLKQRITVFKQFIENGCVDTLDHLAHQCGLETRTVRIIFLGNDELHFLNNFFTASEKEKLVTYYQKMKESNREANPNCSLFACKPVKKNYKENYDKVAERLNYWCQLALTYRLSIYDLCEILGYQDHEGLKTFMLSNSPSEYSFALKYLFCIETAYVEYFRKKEQQKEPLTAMQKQVIEKDKAKKDKCNEDIFYIAYCSVTGAYDKKYQEIIGRFDDTAYRNTIKKHFQNRTPLSDEDIANIVQYKIKYCIPYKQIPVSRNTIKERCPEYLRDSLTSCNEYLDYYFQRTLKKSKKNE